METIRPILVVLAGMLALTACAKQGADPAKVQADVTKAQAEGQEKIAVAQEKFERANMQANAAPANPDAGGIATPAPPVSVDAPPSTTLVAADRAARLADAQFDLDKAKAEQAYNVALARCEDRVGDANKACRDLAKSTYDSAIDSAKAKTRMTHP
jgi:hypothetical protein